MEEILEKLNNMAMLDWIPAKEIGKGVGYSILRVPGGWVFSFLGSSCFVPEPQVKMEIPTASMLQSESKPKKSRSRSKKKED